MWLYSSSLQCHCGDFSCFSTDQENFHGMILLWSGCIVRTGRVSYLALLNVSGVLVRLAALAGTRHAGSWEMLRQIFVYIWVLFKKKIKKKEKMETLRYG